MSWFEAGAYKDPRQLKGVWIRFSAESDIMKRLYKTKLLRWTDYPLWMAIEEYNKERNELGVYIWCKNITDVLRGKSRYNVIFMWIPYDPHLSCEGDLGKGLIKSENKKRTKATGVGRTKAKTKYRKKT